MIVGLTGSICSGKETLALFLVENYGFEAINILELFKKAISEQIQKEKEEIENSPTKKQDIDTDIEQDVLEEPLRLKMSFS